MIYMKFLVQCQTGNRPISFGQRKGTENKRNKYDFDKKLYRKKIQSVFFACQSKENKEQTLQVMQDLVDMTQYFMHEDILYDVLTELEDDMFLYEVCTWYRKIKG